MAKLKPSPAWFGFGHVSAPGHFSAAPDRGQRCSYGGLGGGLAGPGRGCLESVWAEVSLGQVHMVTVDDGIGGMGRIEICSCRRSAAGARFAVVSASCAEIRIAWRIGLGGVMPPLFHHSRGRTGRQMGRVPASCGRHRDGLLVLAQGRGGA